jgi:hypothetical protein
MDAISTGAVTAPAAAATTAASPAADSAAGTKKAFSALFAEAEKDLKAGETLAKVDGHAYGRIAGGTRDQLCVNLSGNKRSGEAFDLVTRHGRSFHVYGSGKDKVSIDMGSDKPAATTSTGTPAAGDTSSGAADAASRARS